MTGWRAPHPSDEARFDPADVFAAGLRNHHVSNTAYPIAHDLTWGPYRVPRDRHEPVLRAAWSGVAELGLYVHVPFCEVRCSFCEYTVVRREEHAEASRYVDDLLRELEMYRELLDGPRSFCGMDVGGGTPSFLPAEELARIVEAVRGWHPFGPGADWSIETTPKIAAAEPAKMAAWKRMGFDRVSMGIQVIEPDLLKVLNRSENGVATHREATDNIRAAGFERLNVDLMYGFADQSEESWRATLEHAVALGPEAITLYRMRYKLTRISHQASRVQLAQVQGLASLAKSVLADAGYRANPGKTTWSRDPGDVGTSSYLARRVATCTPYLGLGLGAQSFSPTTIQYNDGAVGKNLLPYRRSLEAGRLPVQDLYDLPLRQAAGKACAVSFYFGEIDREAFRRRFGVALEDLFAAEFDFVTRRGFMEEHGRTLRLTPEGASHVNGVIALFFAPSVQAYLLERDPDAAQDMARNRRLAEKVGARA